MLQAHTDEEFQTWVSAIQSGVTKAYRAAEKRHSITEVGISDLGQCNTVGGYQGLHSGREKALCY